MVLVCVVSLCSYGGKSTTMSMSLSCRFQKLLVTDPCVWKILQRVPMCWVRVLGKSRRGLV